MRFLTAGESHGPCLLAIVEGLPAGLEIDVEAINRDLARRQGGYGRGGRMQIERDRVEILSGVIPLAGSGPHPCRTTGAPVALRIENRDWANWRDRWVAGDLPRLSVPRPGHADYAGMVKYGLDDARAVLERASARETTARVAVGALVKQLLAVFGVTVGSYVVEIGGVVAAIPDLPLSELWARAEASDVRCPDEEAAARMREAIDAARQVGDSLGGVFVVAATGVPVGLGSYVHWDRRLDARLAAAVMSIPAIKGVEIGPAFENARRPGTQVHDEFERVSEAASQQISKSANRQIGKSANRQIPGVTRTSNRAGGIEGGMTNGMPIVVRAAMKPIPTTLAPLRSVDLATGEPATTQYQRSDVCAVPAASIVGEAMVAWVLADALVEKRGGDSLEEMVRCPTSS
ncbi:MAG: chorismate synthase [Anaerolineae bacterium]|nr:chorismate synthase [Anaerolineae bacterium]